MVSRSISTPSATRPEPFLPGESLTLGDAVSAYTTGSAWVSHLDDQAGSIEIGKYADLIVLDRNPFAAEPTDIAETRVEMTFGQATPVDARKPRPRPDSPVQTVRIRPSRDRGEFHHSDTKLAV